MRGLPRVIVPRLASDETESDPLPGQRGTGGGDKCERRSADWMIGGAPLPARAIEGWMHDDSWLHALGVSRARTVSLSQCMTLMLGATLAATADPAGATVVVSARTGPATTALVVPIARMTWARMVRRIRMICLHASTEVDKPVSWSWRPPSTRQT